MIPIRARIILAVALLGAGAATVAVLRNRGQHGPLVLYGNVDIREVELAFRQPGRLARMAFEEGQTVAAGAVLAELDARPYQDALAAADAEVLRARAELDKLSRGSRPQEIAQAEEAVRQAEAAASAAEADHRRQEALAGTGAASQRVLEAARMARDQAAAGLASARKALDLRQEGSRREDIAAAAARLKGAEAARALAATALEDTRLAAPAPGTLISRLREPGAMVASRDAVYTLSLRDPLYVRAYVGERDLGRVAPGQAVTLGTDSSGKVYHGHVGFISPRAEFTPKSVETADLRTDLVYRLRIVVRDADEGLRQGQPVTVRAGN